MVPSGDDATIDALSNISDLLATGLRMQSWPEWDNTCVPFIKHLGSLASGDAYSDPDLMYASSWSQDSTNSCDSLAASHVAGYRIRPNHVTVEVPDVFSLVSQLLQFWY